MILNVCGNHQPEIHFEGVRCPGCEELKCKDRKIAELELVIVGLSGTIDDLNARLEVIESIQK